MTCRCRTSRSTATQHNPISLYQWAHGFQPGIISLVDHDNNDGTLDLALTFSAANHTLVNNEQKIALVRTGETGNQNVFYAMTTGFNGSNAVPANRISQKLVENVRRPDGSLGSVLLWIKYDEQANPLKYWAMSGEFLDIPF